MIKYFKWFYIYWKQQKIKMISVLMLTLFAIIAKTGFPILLKYVIDAMSGNYELDKVYQLVLIYFAFAIVHELVTRSLPLLRGTINMIIAAMVRNRYYNIYANKNFKFFQKFRTGDLLTRLTDDIDGGWDRIHWYSCSGVLRPIEAVLILIFTLGVMFFYSPTLAMYSFIPLPFLVIIMAKMEDKMVAYTNEKQKSISACNNVLESCFSGIRVIKTTLSEKDQIRKYEEVIEDRITKEKKFLKINQLIHFFSMLVNHAGKLIVIFIGSSYVIEGKISLGTLLLFIIYLERLVEPIWTLSWFYASSKQVFRYVDRLIETEDSEDNKNNSHTVTQRHGERTLDDIDKTDEQKECHSHGGGNPVSNSLDSYELRNVDFRFNSSEDDKKTGNVLSDISFSVKKGETVAVVGSVGSGKTTLLEIIAGNYTIRSGETLFNGKDFTAEQKNTLMKTTGYITQQNVLFSESIRDNIELGDKFTDDEIYDSLKDAMIYDEVIDMPEKLDSVLGHRGMSLSGGQKQRISIARTLIRNPELVLMDDVTAAMDAKTEESFWSNFRTKHPDSACIVVTHRLATAMYADKVIVLKKGKIVEYDTHENLMSKEKSIYSRIMVRGNS